MSRASNAEITGAEVEEWIRGRIAEFVNMDASAISRDANFESFGVDSAKAITLVTEMEDWLDLPDELPLELLFEADSIGEASENIATAIREMAKTNPQFTELQ